LDLLVNIKVIFFPFANARINFLVYDFPHVFVVMKDD
jgi:hypothetical protein